MNLLRILMCCQEVQQPVQLAFEALLLALKKQGIQYELVNSMSANDDLNAMTILIGTAKDYKVKIALEGNELGLPTSPESLGLFVCSSTSGSYLVLAGSDSIGLMYLLYEMARRVSLHGLKAVQDATTYVETPDNQVRCMDRYLLGHLDNEWFMSDEFNEYYFDRLARNRFNRFNLILGFDTAYMSPPYPFFVEVPGFENVRLSEKVHTNRRENLIALRAMVNACHQHGLKFVLATWQQRPWTTEQDSLVENLPETEQGLSDYCHAGIKALLAAVPEIDIVQFRVNHESGVGTQVSAEDFWKRCIDAVAEAKTTCAKNFTLDLRAKGLTDEMIDYAYSRGLDVEVPTKYWCEHAALPYHLSVMRTEELAQLENFNHSRRYSYADMLQKPKKFDLIFRLWNYGSTNLFLWGDADYARRFSKSCALSGAVGFQVNAPLSLKYGHELSHIQAWHIFKNPALHQARWEDERFWLWYVLFGRLGYNSRCGDDIWEEEFVTRFGKEAGGLLCRTLATSSKIVPLITTVHMPVHPSLRYWTELNTGWALFAENNLNQIMHFDFVDEITYGSTEPSDHGLFYGIDEFAVDVCSGEAVKGKYTPLQYAQWLEDLSTQVETNLELLRNYRYKYAEIDAACLDMEMTAELGLYHAWKIRAAYCLAVFRKNQDAQYLSFGYQALKKALKRWKHLSRLGLETYYHDLDFSSAGSQTRRGTWGDLTIELEQDIKSMEELLNRYDLSPDALDGTFNFIHLQNDLALSADIPEYGMQGQEISISATVQGVTVDGVLPVLHYRNVNQKEGLFKSIPMKKNGERYYASIPAEEVSYNWDIMAYITVQMNGQACFMYPGLYHTDYPYPYAVIITRKGE